MKNHLSSLSCLIFLLLIPDFSGFGQNKWRFAVVGDTHVGSSDVIAEMIPFLLADSIDFILLPGDIAEGGLGASGAQLRTQLTQWKTIFEPLYAKGIGVYPLRGNHEDDARDNINAWNTVFSGSSILPQNGPTGEENLSYSFKHKNALVIGLDNYANIHTVNQPWLNQQLSANTLPHVFVFAHEAAFKVFHADCLDDSLAARNIFWQSLAKAGVKVFFCGHDHFLDVSRVDDGDGNLNNDVYQYLAGTGGGWLMSQYSNYNGDNTPYFPKRVFHEMEFGYSVAEISGERINDLHVTITWKKRVWNTLKSVNEFIPSAEVLQYTLSATTRSDNIPKNEIKVYPNPSSGYIHITGASGETKIYSICGRLVWKGKIESPARINISGLIRGTYFLVNKDSRSYFVVNN
jgi:hypothetical protein